MVIEQDLHMILEEPTVKALRSEVPFYWQNSNQKSTGDEEEYHFSMEELNAAEDLLKRFQPFFLRAFPETAATEGLIESPLKAVHGFQKELECRFGDLPKNLYVKLDSELSISGSIKARGGIYEVIQHAETLALKGGIVNQDMDYSQFASPSFKAFFSQYTVAVGSTGNLGLSIGIISAVLGFTVKVHMSSDAKKWKKDMLRSYGALVYEYETDYSEAVASGRRESDQDPMSYFVDDEHSKSLFLGYTVAGRRLEAQLKEKSIEVSGAHPLYVYLPCGVGGGPGGVAYGLKSIFADLVHIYFAEPVQSPCMLLGIATGTHEKFSVQDIGLTNRTVADGLAVGRASAMVSRLMSSRLEGLATVSDESLMDWLKLLYVTEGIKLEPSALAGVAPYIFKSKESDLDVNFKLGTHIFWATGGSMVPEEDFNQWLL